MKRILVIDDMRIFDPLPNEKISHVRTLEEALIILKNAFTAFEETSEWPWWDEIWLDHDLSGDDTIRPLVSLIEEKAYDALLLDVGMFVIITDNPPARDWMIAALSPYYPVEVGKREYRIDWKETPA